MSGSSKKKSSTAKGSSNVVRETFRRRYAAYVDRLAGSVPEQLLADALAEGDEASGLARLLAANIAVAPAQDPLAPARARARDAKEELVARAGGALGVQEAADRLGVTRQAVDQRRRRGTLLAVQTPNGQFVYPAFQFETPALAREIADILGHFSVVDAWTRLSVLLSTSPALGGRTPLDVLREGDREGAIMAVASYGEQAGG